MDRLRSELPSEPRGKRGLADAIGAVDGDQQGRPVGPEAISYHPEQSNRTGKRPLKLGLVLLRDDQTVRHAFLKMLQHRSVGARDRDRQRFARSSLKLDDVGA